MALVVLAVIGGILLFLKLVFGTGSDKRFMESLEGMHVLITGGSSGIGLAIAKRCIEEGAYVTLVARNEGNLMNARDRLLDLCAGDSGRVLTKIADVGDGKGVRSVIEESVRWRPIDIIICNAGAVKVRFFEDMQIEDLEAIGRTNFMGIVYTVHAVLPFLKHRSQTYPCSIVFINSLSAMTTLPTLNLYAPSKHAEKGLGELLRLELLPYNIRICNVFPGFVDTPLFHEGDSFVSTSMTARKLWRFITDRMLQTPEEVAEITIEGIKRGEFLITTTWNGLISGVIGRGNMPAESISRALLELMLLVPVRIGSFVVFYYAKRLLTRIHKEHAS